MKPWIITLLTVVLSLPGMSDARSETIPVDGLAARVNNRVITVGEVMAAMQPIERQLRAAHTGRELMTRLEEAYGRVLDAMIDHALILEEFARLEGNIPPQLVDERISEIIEENFGGDRGEFMQQLAGEGIGIEDFRKDVREQISVMLLRRENVFPNVVVSPRQVRDLYEQRIEQFREPGATRVRMIMIPNEPTEEESDPVQLAERVREEAATGDFAETARAHSKDGFAERGGDWGWIDPIDLRDELASAVNDLPPGEVSPVIHAGDSLYIVKVEDRRVARVVPFAEMRDRLTEEVRRAEEDRIYRAWIGRLKERFHVQKLALPQDRSGF